MIELPELKKIEPQPKKGMPFRIRGADQATWFNECLRSRTGGLELFRWKCPFGTGGEPVFIDGVYYWKKNK